MSEDLLIRHCSPTLAGIKTGNLFSCVCPCRKELTKSVSRLNRKLVPRGIRILPLRVCQGRENLNACVIHLISRLRSEEEFPHEIGLFLSYPPKDVLGFIVNKACNHKCQGCWKVYGDEQESKSIFEKYDLCSKIYFQQWKQGKSIEQLTVAG